MTNPPTLSVLLANYNHARFLPEAFEAILTQTYRPTEIIVIDDGSTDESVAVIDSFAAKSPLIRFIRNERNQGVISIARQGLELATGDYFFGAAADDRILPGFFERSMTLLSEHPDAGLCSTLSLLMDENGVNKGIFGTPVVSSRPVFLPPARVRKILCSVGSWLMGNTTIYRRQALLDTGGFMPELHAFSDGFLGQVIALKHGACFLPEALGVWRRMEAGYSGSLRSSVHLQRSTLQHAIHLMQGQYRDLFPQRYVKLWERECQYHIDQTLQNATQSPQEGFLRPNECRNVNGRNARPGLFFRLLTSCKLRGRTITLLLRHRPWLALRRWLHSTLPRRLRWLVLK